MIRTAAIFLQLLWRDFYVFRKRIGRYAINYCLIFPILNIATFGYIQPGVYFGPGHSKLSIILLLGIFTLSITSLCFTIISPFLFDVEADRYIDYQLMILPGRLLALEMILFPACVASLISLPFFPLARILLPTYFASVHPTWSALLLVLFCICLCCSAYIMAAMCVIKNSHSIRLFWLRCNWPLLALGGFWIPWATLKEFYAPLAYLCLLNPFTYITEGMRSALIGSDQFIPYQICIIALLLFFCIFTITAFYFFKRKMDHVL